MQRCIVLLIAVSFCFPSIVLGVSKKESPRLEQKKIHRDFKLEKAALNLQMSMDKRSQLINTLSGIMKSISDTQDSLVQNIK